VQTKKNALTASLGLNRFNAVKV